MSVYLAPDYFTPTYFASIDPGGLLPAAGVYRDRDAFAAILAALSATREFAGVAFPGPIERTAVGSEVRPLVALTPGRFEEQDDADPTSLLRRVSYRLTIAVRDDDDFAGFDRLDRLARLVRDTLDGSSLGGGCLPGLTRLRRGALDPQVPYPEQRLVLDGEFSYPIARAAGRGPAR